MISSTNGAGKSGYPHTKEESWLPISHHTQKLTTMDQWYEYKYKNNKTHRRKHKGKPSRSCRWQQFLRYDNKSMNNKNI